jgi:hypothetical protein
MRRPTVPFGLIMALFGLAVASCPGLARAQDYPAQPIKIIVATPAGGIADLVGRTLAQKLSAAGNSSEGLGAARVFDVVALIRTIKPVCLRATPRSKECAQAAELMRVWAR